MSSTADKTDDYFFWEQNEPSKKINNNLTPLQATNIINRCILAVKDNDSLCEDLEAVKEWIKSR